MKIKTRQSPITNSQKGYVLTSLLIFIVVIVLISTTSILVSISSMRGQTHFDSGRQALMAADSGIENAILRLLRDPDYNGETLEIDGTTVEILVEINNQFIITAVADSGAHEKTVRVTLDRVDGVLQIISWKTL